MTGLLRTTTFLDRHEPKARYDVVIVGAGVNGLSLAYHLAELETRPAEAMHVARVAMGLARRPGAHPQAQAKALSTLGLVEQGLGHFAEAEDANRKVLELRLHSLGPDHPHVGVSRTNLGLVLEGRGRHAAAIDEHFGHPAHLPRAGLPTEIGPVVAFLASRRNSYMTGANINVDGGSDFT